jgi:hypothetical protein
MRPPKERVGKDDGGLMRSASASESMRGQPKTTRGRLRLARAVGLLVAVLVVIGVAFVAVPRLFDLRYVNIPLLHEYPPSGYESNPLNPSDRADIIPVAEAARVKADLLADGKIEVAAAASGDISRLTQADTGRALDSLRALLQTDASQGVYEKNVNHLDSVLVGHLKDPNDASIVWNVEERGKSTLTYVRRDTGAVVATRTFQFRGRFWMAQVGHRYLIADTQITQQ